MTSFTLNKKGKYIEDPKYGVGFCNKGAYNQSKINHLEAEIIELKSIKRKLKCANTTLLKKQKKLLISQSRVIKLSISPVACISISRS